MFLKPYLLLCSVTQLALMLLGPSFAYAAANTETNVTDISRAETLIFMEDHLNGLRANTSLKYQFTKRGNLEEKLDDTSVVSMNGNKSDGKEIVVNCMSGKNKIDLPLDGDVRANPVILCFLERDIREMKRLTGGAVNYYRKRIRMALAETAKLSTTTYALAGKTYPATEVTIDPYSLDPARSRYAKHANKTYRFILSDKVPGKVLELRSLMVAEGKPGETMIEEKIVFQP